MKKLLLAIIVGSVLGIFIFLLGQARSGEPSWAFSPPKQAVSDQTGLALPVPPTSGIVDIDDKEWHGAKCDNPNMTIVWNMLPRRDVDYEVRFDRDDSRIQKVEAGKALAVKDPANVVEWRICPKQKRSNGSVSWSAVPRTT